MGVDGHGITTLVTFMGCPLHCKLCLNDVCHKDDEEMARTRSRLYKLSPEELYDIVKKDNLYFRATGGGITFGGGEPGLYATYISDFRRICGKSWKLNLETSLNYPTRFLEKLQSVIDYFIIDIKDMSPTIYRNYTGMDNSQVMDNLEYLVQKGSTKNVTIRVPNIPGYNTEEDIEASIGKLNAMGFADIDKFTYIVPQSHKA